MQRLILYLLALVIAICAAEGPPELPLGVGCGITFPLNNKTLDAIAGIGSPTAASADPFNWNHQSSLKTWPRNYKNNALIIFCYLNEHDRGLLADKVLAGTQLWRDALGGSPGTNTGYGVELVESWHLYNTPHPVPKYCSVPGPNGKPIWNPILAKDTLAIAVHPGLGGSARATIGYPTDGSTPFMHIMQIGPTAPAPVVAHEVGHVMGMLHEHQRSDRDEHVRYWCDRIPGFDSALEAARRDFGRQFTKEALCSDVVLCTRYGFLGSQYVKGSFADGANTPHVISPRSQYDVGSIMHYASDQSANDRCKHGTLNECTLVKYIENNPAKGVEKIPVNTKVTSTDAMWVRMYYPWRPEKKSDGADGSDGVTSGNNLLVVDGKVDVLV